MKFVPTELKNGSFVIEIESDNDIRGFFARTVCRHEFSKRELNFNFIQQSISFNPHKGTLRGMHFQQEPFAEEKLVRVTRGAIFDVIVDIRPESSNFKKWFSVELSAENRRQIYVPKGFAHGFQTLKPDTEVFYQMTVPYAPGHSKGFFWNDPSVSIKWPEIDQRIIGMRDLNFSYLSDVEFSRYETAL